MVLADQSYLNIEKVINTPLRECFYFLSYQKDKMTQQRLESLRNKKS